MLTVFLLLAWSDGDQRIVPPESLDIWAREKQEISPKGRVFTGGNLDVLNAQFIGPRPMYNEPWSDGTVSGRMTFILPHPTDPNVIYIAAAGGGVWKTTDGGNTWTVLTDGLPTTYSGALAFDPNDPNTLYYGTGELHYCGDCFPGDGLFKSTDGGATWAKIATTDEVGSYISRIAIRPDNSDVIFVASNMGLARSTDGGVTWSWVFNENDVNSIVINPNHPDSIFIGVYSRGVYLSTDGGDNWTRLTSLPTSGIGRVELATHPQHPNYLLASFVDANTGGLYGLYKSTDGGATWTQLPAPDYLYSQGNYDHHITFHPYDTSIIFAGGVFPYNADHHGIVRSLDGGASWEDVTDRGSNGKVHPDIHFFAWGADTALYVASDGGLWRSHDLGDSWENLNEDIGVTQFYTVDIKPDYSGLVLGGTQDNGTAIYYDAWGDDWQNVRGGDGGPVLWLLHAPDTFLTTYIQMSSLSMYQWTGSTFQYVYYIGTPWSGDPACWACGPLKSEPTGTQPVVYAGTDKVYKSTDGGFNWTDISGDLTDGYLVSMAISRSSDTMYVGTSVGELLVSFDGGLTWIPRTLPDVSGWEDIRDIWIDPDDASRVYAIISQTYGAKVVYSEDAGETWTDISGDLPARPYSMAVEFRTDPDAIFVGTLYGLYYSTDGGSTYTLVSGMPRTGVMDIDIDTIDNVLVAATHGRGMWAVDITPLFPVVLVPELQRGDVNADYGDNWEPGETMTFDVQLINTGTGTAFDVIGRIETSSSDVIIIDTNATWPNIAAGDSAFTIDGGFTVRADSSASDSTMVEFRLIVEYQDSLNNLFVDTFDIAFMITTSAYLVYDVDAGRLIVTISNNGAFPSSSEQGSAPAAGSGFVFDGTDQLYYGGFALGKSLNDVSDMWYGETGTDADFTNTEGIYIGTPPAYADFMAYAVFADASDVVVRQEALTIPGLDNAVVINYHITNGGTSDLSNLYAGIFMDFDIGVYNQDTADTDYTRNLAYMYFGNVYAGVMYIGTLTGGVPFASASPIDNSTYVYNGTPDSIKYKFLSGELVSDGSSPNDYSIVASAGPFSLSAGAVDTVVLSFGLLADTTLDGLLATADSLKSRLPVGSKEAIAIGNFDFSTGYRNGVLFVNLSVPRAQGVLIDLYNISGRRVATLYKGRLTAGRYTIEASGIPSGIYVLHIRSESGIFKKPVVIMR